jgi:hypothetical protein
MSPGPSAGSTGRRECFTCKQPGHYAAECPDRANQSDTPRPVCNICKSSSHVEEQCWKRCPACKRSHATPEECEINKMFAALKTWATAEGKTGTLPAEIQKHLN